MIRRFVIGIEGFDRENEIMVRNYLSKNGTWWHWIPNFWLFVTEDSDISAREIRNHLKTINRTGRALVLEFPGDVTWAGFGSANANGKNMYDWLKGKWADE